MATLADINDTLLKNNALQEQSDSKLDALAQLWADYTFDYRRRQENESKQALEDAREASSRRSGGAVRGAVERVSNAAGRGMSAFDSLMSDPRTLIPLAAVALRNALKKGLIAGTVVAFADEAAEAITDYFGTPEYKAQVEAGLVAGGFASLINKRFGIVTGAIIASMSPEQQKEAMEAAKEIATKFGEIYDQLNLPGFKEIGEGINRGLDGLSSLVQGDLAGFGDNLAESMLLLGGVAAALAPGKVAGLALWSGSKVLGGLKGLASFATSLSTLSFPTSAALANGFAIVKAGLLTPAGAVIGVAALGALATAVFMQTDAYKKLAQADAEMKEKYFPEGGTADDIAAEAAYSESPELDTKRIQLEAAVESQYRPSTSADKFGDNFMRFVAGQSNEDREMAATSRTEAERFLRAYDQQSRTASITKPAPVAAAPSTSGTAIETINNQVAADAAMGRGAPTIVNAPQSTNVSNSQPVMFSNNKPSSSHNRFTSN